MTKRTLAVLFAVVSLSAASSTRAVADETPAARVAPGTITLKTTTVVGRSKRPSVVIEVMRAKADVKLADLEDPAVEKIIRAASKAPF